MIYLKDFLTELALGNLNGTSVVSTGDYQINPIHLPKVIIAINDSLKHFYSKFNLRYEQTIIKLIDGISHYYLDSRFALSNEELDYPKYIMDTTLYPFKDNVIQILEVSTLSGFNLVLRDSEQRMGVLIPEYNCIHVPMDLGVDTLSIYYKAGHELIPYKEGSDSLFELNIPASLEVAFKAYCACLILRYMGGTNLEISNSHFAVYASEIENQIDAGNGLDHFDYINRKGIDGGWL